MVASIIVSYHHTESTCLPSGNTYNISKSRFHNNIIEWEKNDPFSFWKLAYGGGLNVVFAVNTTRNKLLISNSTFNNNSALYGGGMFLGINSTKSFVMIQNSIFNSNTAMKGSGIDVICENTCHNNTINISSSQFKNNEISQIKFNDKGGSGIAIGISGHQFGVPDGNNFILHNCVFTKNKALFGGGTYIHCGQQFLNKVVNRINFTNCIWKNNLAPISPAVDVSAGYSSVSQTQYNIVNVTFTNCTFIKNKVDHYYFFNGSQSFLNTKQYTGTFLVMQVPVDFAGNTSFTDNYGTAILVSSSVITFFGLP